VNWGIGAKIVLGYSVIILFLAFSILMVNNQMTSLQREIDRNTKQSMESNQPD
jgi:cell division protein FtsL